MLIRIHLLRLCSYESPMKRFPSHGVVKFLCGRRRRRRRRTRAARDTQPAGAGE